MKRRPLAPRFGKGHDPGLCGMCRHGREVDTLRGTRDWRCRRSDEDARYPRYPQLPVLASLGWEHLAGSDDDHANDPEPILQPGRP